MAKKTIKKIKCSTGSGAVYGFGLMGALVYYLQQASSFSEGLVGIVKAIIWPALLIYKGFTLLQM